MVNVTINVDADLKRRLEEHPEINWSEVARQAWRQKIEDMELLDRLTAKSRTKEGDVKKLAQMLKEGIAKRHR